MSEEYWAIVQFDDYGGCAIVDCHPEVAKEAKQIGTADTVDYGERLSPGKYRVVLEGESASCDCEYQCSCGPYVEFSGLYSCDKIED